MNQQCMWNKVSVHINKVVIDLSTCTWWKLQWREYSLIQCLRGLCRTQTPQVIVRVQYSQREHVLVSYIQRMLPVFSINTFKARKIGIKFGFAILKFLIKLSSEVFFTFPLVLCKVFTKLPFKKNVFIYLCLAVLDLRCSARASHCGGVSCCGARL